MIILSCKNIHKSYGIDIVLDKVSFSINEGEKVGFVGSNGAGKSTLFKILTGTLDHDEGDLYIDKGKKLGYLSQNLSLESSNTMYDEMLLVFDNLIDMERRLSELETKLSEPYDESNGDYHNKLIENYTKLQDNYNLNGGYTFRTEISKVLYGLGFSKEDFDKTINILSGGQKTRLALCKLLLTNPDILLLDEPTNHLDLKAIEWLEEYLKSYSGSIIIISHDRYFLDAITNRTIELISGKVKEYNGNYSKFIELKKKNYELELKAYNLQQSEIKRQEEIITRFKSFNREKSIKAAESRQKALDKVDRIDAPDKEYKINNLMFEPKVTSGNDVLSIKNLSKSFGEKHLFSNLNGEIKKQDKIALIGENGRGKTTLFRIVMDKISSDEGYTVKGTNVQIGYYDQEQSDLNPNKTILEEVWDTFPTLNNTQIRSALASFLFTGDDVKKMISSLSGGEKCRINLLKLMLNKSNFLLLDEPTNHLDIMSREALEDSLIDYKGTLLVISHDRYFLNKVIDKIWELNEYDLKEYLGNYSYFVEKKANPTRFVEIEESEGKTKTQINAEKRKKRDEEKAEKQKKLLIKKLEEEIASTEDAIVKCQEKLCLEEVYSNPEESIKVNNEIAALEGKLESLYGEWEELV